MGFDSRGPRLYVSQVQHKDGSVEVDGYIYGDPWVEQALLMGDIKFKTPEAAKAWWYRNYGVEDEQD